MNSKEDLAANTAELLAAVLRGTLAFVSVYALLSALHLPALVYEPAAHRWLVATRPAGLQMRYYSDFGVAAVVALATCAFRLYWGKRGGSLAAAKPEQALLHLEGRAQSM